MLCRLAPPPHFHPATALLRAPTAPQQGVLTLAPLSTPHSRHNRICLRVATRGRTLHPAPATPPATAWIDRTGYRTGGRPRPRADQCRPPSGGRVGSLPLRPAPPAAPRSPAPPTAVRYLARLPHTSARPASSVAITSRPTADAGKTASTPRPVRGKSWMTWSSSDSTFVRSRSASLSRSSSIDQSWP